MTQSEFEDLVGMTVTVEEYSNIEAVYMACDADKYAFCEAWEKLNTTRIANYQAQRMAAEAKRMAAYKAQAELEYYTIVEQTLWDKYSFSDITSPH